MAAKTAEEAAGLDPCKQAMWIELGYARLDSLPMEDSKRGGNDDIYSHPSNLSSGATNVVPNIPIKSAWAEAIKRGDFDDDDAAQVSGMDSMADGQLARARRIQAAGNTAFAFANENNERNIRRDRNGLVPPRATAGSHGRRNVPGPIPVGDGPIDINYTLSGGNVRQPRPAPSTPKAMFGRGAFAGGPSSRLSARAQPAQPKPRVPQPAVTKPQGQGLPDVQSTDQTQVRVALPDGASIILELPASLAAAALPKKKERYSGKVYLISAAQPSEDMLMLAVRDQSIPNIKHLISEYDTYMSASTTGVMLKFTTSANGFVFYGVDFEDAPSMNSFVKELRGLVERPQQHPQGAVTAVKVKSSAEEAKPLTSRISEVAAISEQKKGVAVQKEREREDVVAHELAELDANKQEEAASVSRQTAQPVQAVTGMQQTHTTANVVPEAAEQDLPKPFQADSAPVQPTQAPSGVSPEVIEEIIDWAWHTAKYMQHCVPEEFGFNTMRDIILATSVATTGRSSPSFRKLDHVNQQRVIEGYVRPRVERGFLQKLARDEPLAAESANTEVRKESPQLPKAQDNAEAHTAALSNLSAPVYQIEDLLSMRPAAASIKLALPKMPRRPSERETRQHDQELPRVPIEERVRQTVVANSDWLKNSKASPVMKFLTRGQSSVNAFQATSHANFGLDHGTPSPGNSKVDALEDFFSPGLSQSGSPPTGLRASIHNRGGAQLLGHKSSANKSTYQKDLEDLVAKADTGNALDHKVVKATEGISRLSLK